MKQDSEIAYKKQRSITRRDQVAEKLRYDILTGVLRPGEIVRDVELAERYGTSTSPIREALLLLAVESLIIMPPNNVKRVSPLDKETAQNNIQLFEVLSNFAFKEAVTRFNFTEVAKLESHFKQLECSIGDRDLHASLATARSFFQEIFIKLDNPQLLRVLTLSSNWLGRLFYLVYSFDEATNAWKTACEDVLKALKCQNRELAVSSFQSFIADEKDRISRLPLL